MYCLDWCMLPRCVAGYWLWLLFFPFEWNPGRMRVIQPELTDVGNIDLKPLCIRLQIALGNSDGSYFRFRQASLLRPFRARCLPIDFAARSLLPLDTRKRSVNNIELSNASCMITDCSLFYYGSVPRRIKRHSREENA